MVAAGAIAAPLLAHPPHGHADGHDHAHADDAADVGRSWRIASTGSIVHGTFLACREGLVTIETDDGGAVSVPTTNLSESDQAYVSQRMAAIAALNGATAVDGPEPSGGRAPPMSSLLGCATPPGNGALMVSSFTPFRPNVRFYWDANFFYEESDGMPDPVKMPNIMVGITNWQQQLPVPVGFFASVTNPETSTGSLGYGQPNVWRMPLVPVAATTSTPLSGGNFQRGAVALAANGIPIFNPRNNRGEFSQAIGELDVYGGHCGRADDYHYHIAPTHLREFLGTDKPIAWALDGYPIYGYTEPDGSARLPLDADGGHSHGSWGYHYHAIGSDASGPASPYLMNAMHGTVVNFGGQVDPQPEVSPVEPDGLPLPGATIISSSRPTADAFSMTYTYAGKSYAFSWTLNRAANAITIRRETPTGTTNLTYTSTARFPRYAMASQGMLALPDTGQSVNATATPGEDSDYTINAPSFTDHGNGTVTDNVTGLMWQKTDSGEMTWDNAVAGAAALTLGGHTDWRLPTPAEAFSILNHGRNPALDASVFTSGPSGTPQYWWTDTPYGTDATRIWVTNAGGGLGPHPKTETLSAGGTSRFCARYVRGARPTLGHTFFNNGDGTVTDTDTGLMWTQVPAAAMNWNAALAHAEGLATGGYADWRLPNVKELQSLVEITQCVATSAASAKAAVNRKLFPTVAATAFWSSTALLNGSLTSAWLVELGVNTSVPPANGPSRGFQGTVSYELQTSTYPVLAVRTAQPCTIEGDLDGNGAVDGGDLAVLLLDFGPCFGCPSDLYQSGTVDFGDVAYLLLLFS